MTFGLLPVELIYDAAFDSESFAQLPFAIATAFDARSTALHWHNPGQPERGEFLHNRYFADSQLSLLDGDLVCEDLWSNAVNAPDRVNRPWLTQDLVDPALYEKGRLYNDWIRAMGDDSFHGVGAAITGGAAIGEIGLHRGRTQRPFEDSDVAQLTSLLAPLRRMLDIRAKLAAEREYRSDLIALLDRASDAMLILQPDGRLLYMNSAGEALLASGDALSLHNGIIQQRHRNDAITLTAAVAKAGKGSMPQGTTTALRGSTGSYYAVTVAPVMVGAYRRIILVVSDVNRTTEIRVEQAARLFGLSPAEGAIAALLITGMSLRAIADRRGVSVLTVRAQTKTIMSKLGVRSQVAIAAVLMAVPGLVSSQD